MPARLILLLYFFELQKKIEFYFMILSEKAANAPFGNGAL